MAKDHEVVAAYCKESTEEACSQCVFECACGTTITADTWVDASHAFLKHKQEPVVVCA